MGRVDEQEMQRQYHGDDAMDKAYCCHHEGGADGGALADNGIFVWMGRGGSSAWEEDQEEEETVCLSISIVPTSSLDY